jgi:Bacterial Ig domain
VIRLRILVPVCFAALVVTGAVAAPEVTVSAPSVGAYISGSDPDPYPISAAAAPEEGTSVEFFRCDDASVDCAGGTWVSVDSDATAPFSVPWPLDPDGNRALRAVATDTTGSTTSPIVNVVIDRTAPAGGLTAPADNSFVAGAETLNANPTDPVSGVASVEFQRSPAGTGNWTTIATDDAAPWSAPWSTTSMPDGDVDLRVVKTDVAGNSTPSAVRTVTVDNTPPTGVSVAYADGYDPNGSIAVTVANGQDSGSGLVLASARLERRVATLAAGACSAFEDWTVVQSPNAVASGTCAQYRYSIADALGNRSEATSGNVARVDLTPPAVGAIDLVESEPDEHAPGTTLFYNPATGNGGSFTVSATSSDPESGIGSVVFPDVFGADGATDSAGPYSHAYQWTNADEATGQKAVILRNNAGLERNATFTVTPDTAGPADGSVSYQKGYNTTGNITVTIGPGTDGGSGINAASASLERRTTALLEGACGAFPASWTAATSPDSVPSGSCVQYRYSVGDNVGNETSYLSTAVSRVDTSTPAVANLAPAPAAGAESQYFEPGSETLYFRPVGAGSFTLRATVSDPESGDDRVNFPNFDALPGWTAAGGADVAGPGPYVSPAYAWSGAAASPGARVVRGQNNAGLGANTTITITADSADPSGGSVTYPNGYDKDGVVAVTGTAGTDALSGVDPTTARLERGVSNLASGTCPAPASWTALAGNSDTVANGQCARYRYRVSDRVGNEAIYTSPNVVRVDTAAPSPPGLTVTESSPHAAVTGSEIFVNTAQTGSFEVAATVSDPDSGIDKVQFPARPDDSAPPFEATYTFLDLTGGQTVTVFDAAGNTASSPFTVTPDTTGPSGGAVSYTNGFDADGIVAITTSDGSDSNAGIAPASRRWSGGRLR